MIRNNKQWSEWCHRYGTSGDQVFQILSDWRESEGIVNKVCEWVYDIENSIEEVEVIFKTECGNLFYSNWLSKYRFNFCPFCGNEIYLKRTEELWK